MAERGRHLIDKMADAARRQFFRSHRHPLLPWSDAPEGTRKIWRRVARAMISEMAVYSDSEIVNMVHRYREKANAPLKTEPPPQDQR